MKPEDLYWISVGRQRISAVFASPGEVHEAPLNPPTTIRTARKMLGRMIAHQDHPESPFRLASAFRGSGGRIAIRAYAVSCPSEEEDQS